MEEAVLSNKKVRMRRLRGHELAIRRLWTGIPSRDSLRLLRRVLSEQSFDAKDIRILLTHDGSRECWPHGFRRRSERVPENPHALLVHQFDHLEVEAHRVLCDFRVYLNSNRFACRFNEIRTGLLLSLLKLFDENDVPTVNRDSNHSSSVLVSDLDWLLDSREYPLHSTQAQQRLVWPCLLIHFHLAEYDIWHYFCEFLSIDRWQVLRLGRLN